MKYILAAFTFLLFYSFTLAQSEKMDVDGAVTVGAADNMAPAAGTLQWDGSNFQGYNGSSWMNLGGSFDPSLPPSFTPTSIVSQNNVLNYVVPVGSNLYITDLRSTGTMTVGGITFTGFQSNLASHLAFVVGEGMTIANAGTFSFNGFLIPKQRTYFTHDLSSNNDYTVPNGKTLFITNADDFSNIVIAGTSLFGAKVAFSGQTVEGDAGVFIGFLQ